MVVAVSLPLPERTQDTRELFKNLGFDASQVMDIIAEQDLSPEWRGVSTHLLRLMAAFQENQGVSVDCDLGVGASAGLPLAGLIAIVALSKVTRRIQKSLDARGLVVWCRILIRGWLRRVWARMVC